MLNKTPLKLEFVYCRECSSGKQCYNRALYKVSNLVSAVCYFNYLAQAKKSCHRIKYLKYVKLYRIRKVEIFPPCTNAIT